MSKFTRHEVVMNGANTEGKLQRTLVLDNQLSARHVFKLNKHFKKCLNRTSQIAYATDYLIETTMTVSEDESKLDSIELAIFRLSGPFNSAGGRPQLYRIEADVVEADMIRAALKTEDFKQFREFLLLDETLTKPLEVNPYSKDAVLPTFVGWDGQVGITEEKQSAYVIDLLGGAPVYYAEEMAINSMYSRRQFIMPFDTNQIPAKLDFEPCGLAPTPGIVLAPDSEINWVIFHHGGGVSIITNEEEAALIARQDIMAALKLYVEPFIDESNERYGLLIEVFSDKAISPFCPTPDAEETEVLAAS